MKHLFKLFLTIISFACASFLLTGCASLQTSSNSFFSSTRTCQTQYGAKGRFSMRYRIEGKEETLHGQFDWRQSTHITTITLYSPIGQAVAFVEVRPDITTFTAAGHAPKSAANTEALLKEQMGWSLPVSGLKTWLQGCAIDLNGQAFTASPKNAEVITKDGWQINYLDWASTPKMLLPKRINLVKGSYDLKNVDITLKLIIDEWHF